MDASFGSVGVSLYPLKVCVFIHSPRVWGLVYHLKVWVFIHLPRVWDHTVGVSLSFGAGGRNLWPTLKMESDSGGDTPC